MKPMILTTLRAMMSLMMTLMTMIRIVKKIANQKNLAKIRNVSAGSNADITGFDLQEEETQLSMLGDDADIKSNRMAQIDVTIIQTEEKITTSKGVNLLNNLEMTFEAAGKQAEARATATAKNWTSTITATLAIPQIRYSMNILNAAGDKSDILARPSLLALDGKASNFSFGEKEFFTVRGQESGALEKVTAGLQISVKPQFLSNNLIRIAVKAERSGFQPSAALLGTFQEAIKTKNTKFTANSVMRFDQTLILSGFNERTNSRDKSGVPFLQNIPGIQYFFSEANTSEIQTSILILLTLRKPTYAYTDGTPIPAFPPDKGPGGDESDDEDENGSDDNSSNDSDDSGKGKDRGKAKPAAASASPDEQPNLNQWTIEAADLFSPVSTVDVVMEGLHRSNAFFRQFRTGDIHMEEWDSSPSIANTLKHALGFLYY
tara:strand:- start:16111 stop:17409 length:1299 start_codon:yes stop_codon:yes gene_type:complete